MSSIIDFHTHPVMIKELLEKDPQLERSTHEVFGFFFPPQPLEGFLLEMDEAGVDQAVLLPIDATSAHGVCIGTNEQVAELAGCEPRLLGFASVDPNLEQAPRQLERAVRQLGLRGLKLDPALQAFWPGDREHAFPVYQACAELGVPLLIHCGLSWTPSGQGQYARPLLLEEAVQTFPGLNFVLAHFAWPFIEEALLLAIKYPNVYLDTAILYSGTPGQALRRVLDKQVGLEVVERSLAHKIVFGSNYPRVDMRRFVRGVKNLKLSASTETAILGGNARRLLKLEKAA